MRGDKKCDNEIAHMLYYIAVVCKIVLMLYLFRL